MGNLPSMPISSLHAYVDRHGGCKPAVSASECLWAHRWYTNWNTADLAFGQPMVIFLCAVIAFFAAVNGVHLLRQTHVGSILLLNLPAYKFVASLARGVGGRQARMGHISFLPSGTSLLIAALVAFSAGFCFVPTPYYWPNEKFGHSPPLATRAGWMSLAILPFQVLLAAKWNLITVLTGYSHEKLQPLHRWAGWVMYALALIHTFPFIVIDIRMGMIMHRWRTSFQYGTGVAALVPETFLVAASIAAIRSRYYETFKSLHLIVAAFFIVMLFIHCNFIQTSADYFIGFAAVYLLSLIMRWGKSFKHGFHHRAVFELLDDSMLRIDIPSRVTYAPGQHFFLRFLDTGLHSLTSHPFTIASDSSSGKLEVFARVHRGITARLADIAGKQDASIPVLLDGPYGGVGCDLGVYDRILLVGGGSGGAFILALARNLALSKLHTSCRSVTVLFATRSPQSLGWFKDAFESTIAVTASHNEFDVRIFVTSMGAATASERLGALETKPSHSSSSSSVNSSDKEETQGTIIVTGGRPNLSAIIGEHMSNGGTLGVAACGPESLTSEVRNAVARGQLRIASGVSEMKECFLHTEAFGW